MNTKLNQKVLIAAPVGSKKDYSLGLWLEWISKQNYTNFDLAVCTNGERAAELYEKFLNTEIYNKNGEKVLIRAYKYEKLDTTLLQKLFYCRELLRLVAVKYNYDYLFFLDTDTIPISYNSLNELINSNVDVVSGVYFYKNSKVPVALDKQTLTNFSLKKLEEAYNKNELLESCGVGLGCCLIKRNIFIKYKFDYEKYKELRSDDFSYCDVLLENNIKIYVNPRILCLHLDDKINLQHKLTEIFNIKFE